MYQGNRSSNGSVLARIGATTIALVAAEPAPVPRDEKPAVALAPVRCDACAAVTVIEAPMAYHFYDDDHFGRLEIWYRSKHAGQCRLCQAPLSLELSYTHTTYPTTRAVELTLDGVQVSRGGTLASTGDVDSAARPREREGGGAHGDTSACS
jgi:hypothetical protein